MSETCTIEQQCAVGELKGQARSSQVGSNASVLRFRRGFTLLELLVVLVILVLVVAIAGPSLSRSSATELKASARSLAVGLRWTRNVAVTENRAATLSVDVDQHLFQLPGESRVRAIPESVHVTLFTARSEVENEVRGSIRFFPDGSSTGGRITLSTNRLAYLIDVDWLTGKVRLLEGDPESAGEAH